MNETNPDFPFFVVRSLRGGEQEVELAIQVKHYEAPSIDSLDHRDPAHNSGVVEFGDAVQVDTGTTMELSEMEWERAEREFWGQ